MCYKVMKMVATRKSMVSHHLKFLFLFIGSLNVRVKFKISKTEQHASIKRIKVTKFDFKVILM